VDGNSAYSNVKTSLLDTSKDKFILSTLYNMAVNIDDEGSKRRLSGDCSDVVKALVSSTELEYQFKNKDAKSGLFNIKLIVCGNTPLKSQLLSKD
jgi:phage/plasmid-associated DNA primase